MNYKGTSEREKLLAKREYLLEAAENLTRLKDYTMLSETLAQISEISRQLGDFDVAGQYFELSQNIIRNNISVEGQKDNQTSKSSFKVDDPEILSPEGKVPPFTNPLPSQTIPPSPTVLQTTPSTQPSTEISVSSLVSSSLDELIAQKRIDQGVPLESGIVPTIVKD